MKAFVLMKVRTGEIRDVVRMVRRVEGVKEASMTFGPYDVVAIIEADDVRHLGNIMAMGLQPIPGMLETMTCLSVDID
jgi:DNA-binding Lrp family transcriptional regulator